MVCRVPCILWIYHRSYRLPYVSLGERELCVCVHACLCVEGLSVDMLLGVGGGGGRECTGVWLAVASDKDKVCSLVNKALLCDFSV